MKPELKEVFIERTIHGESLFDKKELVTFTKEEYNEFIQNVVMYSRAYGFVETIRELQIK